MAEETVYNDSNVNVTTARVVIGGTTYALRNITSVKMQLSPAKQGCAIVTLIFGIMGVMVGRVSYSDSPAMLIFGCGLVVCAILWLRSNKPVWHLIFASASGETQALTSKNKEYIERIVASINEAIVRFR
jgi:hypothetical protein